MPELHENQQKIERKKSLHVYCWECDQLLSRKAIESCLLSDISVRLISTNEVSQNVAQIYNLYFTDKCKCAIRDVACLRCGNVVGYQVIQPCISCLEGKNNGNLLIFRHKKVKTHYGFRSLRAQKGFSGEDSDGMFDIDR